MSAFDVELICLVEEFISISKKLLDQNIITMEQHEKMVRNKIEFLNQVNKEIELIKVKGVG